MERATKKDREEFIRLMINHTPDKFTYDLQYEGLVRQVCKRLMYYSATYARIQELWCNGPEAPNGLTPEQYRRIDDHYNNVTVPYYERKEARIEQKIKDLCASIECEPVFSGDPRGATVKIKMSDGFTNDWGREGICVPTS